MFGDFVKEFPWESRLNLEGSESELPTRLAPCVGPKLLRAQSKTSKWREPIRKVIRVTFLEVLS